MTNCPNCGAPVDPAADRCAYCGTPYPAAIDAPFALYLDTQAIASAVSAGLITVNEARRRLGLREV